MKQLENWNIEISFSELIDYKYCKQKLTALEEWGVDNWEWYWENPWPDIDEITIGLMEYFKNN